LNPHFLLKDKKKKLTLLQSSSLEKNKIKVLVADGSTLRARLQGWGIGQAGPW